MPDPFPQVQTDRQPPRQSQPPPLDIDHSKDGTSLTDPSAAGVIVISFSGRMLHMNGQARVFMALFGEMHGLWPHLAPESLPSILSEFCREVFAQLQSHAESPAWTQFEMRRVCHMVTPPLLLRGFAVPHLSHQEPCMILTLQPAPLDPLAPAHTHHAADIADVPADPVRDRS